MSDTEHRFQQLKKQDDPFIDLLQRRRVERILDLEAINTQLTALESRRREVIDSIRKIDAVMKEEAPDLLSGQPPLIDLVAERGAQFISHDEAEPSDLPVTRSVMRLLCTEEKPMSVGEVFKRMVKMYPHRDPKKLRLHIRIYLSARKRSGLLKTITSEDGPLRYFPANRR